MRAFDITNAGEMLPVVIADIEIRINNQIVMVRTYAT
jgi:hypothetical protein